MTGEGRVTLADRIEAHGPALAGRVVEQLYRDPFWQERFGERGRRFAEEDGRHHVSYLVQALRVGEPDVLRAYAQWLQGVLTPRGMCSRHLSDNFALLADALLADGLDAEGTATAYLRAAQDALRYPDGAARPIQEQADVLAARTVDAVSRQHPEWLDGRDEAGRARCQDAVRSYVSYLADAVALERPELFADHMRWTAGSLARRSIPVGDLDATLAALEGALTVLPARAREPALAALAAGRAAAQEAGGAA